MNAVRRDSAVEKKGQSGPSPFPLLILILLISAVVILKLRAEERQAFTPLVTHTALPEAVR